MNKKIKNITLCAIFCAGMVCCAQISLPMPSGVSFTLQSFAAALIGFSLKPRRAFVCNLIYVMSGAIGLPFFSAFSGGMGTIFGPTGGFLMCLPVFSALCGTSFYVNHKVYKTSLIVLAVALLHLCGILWFSYVTANPFLSSFLSASLIYLPKDFISVFAAFLVSKRIIRFIEL